jgi:hypothetical protein
MHSPRVKGSGPGAQTPPRLDDGFDHGVGIGWKDIGGTLAIQKRVRLKEPESLAPPTSVFGQKFDEILHFRHKLTGQEILGLRRPGIDPGCGRERACELVDHDLCKKPVAREDLAEAAAATVRPILELADDPGGGGAGRAGPV